MRGDARNSSIFLDALDIHDAAPAARVTLDVVLHLLGRGWHRDVADDRKLVTNIRQLEDFADLPIEPVDDGTRGAARRGKAEPGHDLEAGQRLGDGRNIGLDRKSTRLNSSHLGISYAVFCLKKKKKKHQETQSKCP